MAESGLIGVVLGTGWKDQCILPAAVRRYGRRHPYETFYGDHATSSMATTVAMRDAFADGVETVVLTNAAGSVNPDLEVGEVVCISDHLNLTGLPAATRFTAMSGIYTLVDGFRRGVFAQVAGPAFETPAEARMLRAMGADLVGMSTALEAAMAHELGMNVVGLSVVTDVAGTDECHDDVLAAAAKVDLDSILNGVLAILL